MKTTLMTDTVSQDMGLAARFLPFFADVFPKVPGDNGLSPFFDMHCLHDHTIAWHAC